MTGMQKLEKTYFQRFVKKWSNGHMVTTKNKPYIPENQGGQ